jgi:hypothetical protein
VRQAIERGKAKGIRIVASALFENCVGGNAAAQIFFLKAHAGWAEKLEVTGKDGSPITLAAMREAFATEIEAKSVPKQITDESESTHETTQMDKR